MNIVRNEIRQMWIYVDGVRLRPLINLQTEQPAGQEVLTLLTPGISQKKFFSSLSADACLLQFFDQVDFVLQKKLPGLSFLPLSFRVLSDKDCLRQLNQSFTAYRHQVIIEMIDPERLILANRKMLKVIHDGIHLLQYHGWQIWLNGLISGVYEILKNTGIRFDGLVTSMEQIVHIKTGHKNYHGENTPERIIQQAMTLVRTGENNILIKGIVTQADIVQAKKTGALWGQGYLWPEEKLYFRGV